MIVDVFPKRSSSVVDNKEPLATTNQTHNRDQSSTIVLASVGMDCYELTNGEDPHRCSNTSHTSNNLSPTVFPGIARTVETPVRVGKEDVAASFLSSPPTTAPPSPSLTDMMFKAERVGNEEGAASLLSSPSTTTTTTAPPSPSLTDMMFTAFKELRLFSAARNDHPDSRAPCRPVSIRSFETMVDKVWAQDWFDMKKEERNRNQEHIHGILDPSTIISIKDDETRELITMNLALLDLEIGTAAGGNQWCPGTLVHGHVRALHLHTQVCPQSPDCYVRSEFFRIQFLRAEKFNPKKAAVLYFKHLNVLLRYFGDRALLRQVRLDDLDSESLQFLKNGHIQLLPSRDRSGRRILCCIGGKFDAFIRPKVLCYLIYVVLGEDVTVQSKGFVIIDLHSFGPYDRNDIDLQDIHSLEHAVTVYQELLAGIPAPLITNHCCFPNTPIYNFRKALILTVFGMKLPERIKIHTGSQTELMYTLQSYGICSSDIHMTFSGSIKIKNLTGFLKCRNSIDTFRQQQVLGSSQALQTTYTSQPPPGIECPDIDCVLFGFGRFHPHNADFRAMIQNAERKFIALNSMHPNSTPNTSDEEIGVESPNGTDDGEGTTTGSSGRHSEIKQLKSGLIDDVVDEMSQKYSFCVYDKQAGWYVPVGNDRPLIRSKIAQALRDNRRRNKEKSAAFRVQVRQQQSQQRQQQQQQQEQISLQQKDKVEAGVDNSSCSKQQRQNDIIPE